MTGSVMELFQLDLLRFMGQGLLVTLQIGLFSIVFATVLGVVAGVMRYSRMPVLSQLAGIYVEAMRNSPLLLLILLFRFASPFRPLASVIVAMTLFTGAILAEVVRGGLNAVDKGQWEAARSQGFTYLQTLRFVVLPQALRKMIPPMFGQFITVIKDTSFAWAVAIEELTGKGMIIAGKYGSMAQFFTIFGVIALTYFVICHLLSRFARWQERRMNWLAY